MTIAAADGEPLTPVQLQKTLFLLGQELPSAVGADFYRFEPYSYGPFDAGVYREAERLSEEGFVEIEQAPWGRFNQYRATPEGRERAAAIRDTAPVQATEYLTTIVQWARHLTFPALVRAIYAKYPEYRVNSVFND